MIARASESRADWKHGLDLNQRMHVWQARARSDTLAFERGFFCTVWL